ncbi:DUF4347 domain-containing protein, partial [Thalassobaculum litoreum]
MTIERPDTDADAAPDLVLIDARVPAADGLLAALARPCRVVRMPQGADGLALLRRALSESRTPPSSVHLISHGAPGRLLLGRKRIDTAALRRSVVELADIRRRLAGAPVTLYGCSVGAGESGRAFVATLAAALGSRVLASSTPTGAASRGGDWNFDVAVGASQMVSSNLIELDGAALWPGLLDVDVTSNSGDDSDNTLQWAAVTANAAAALETPGYQNVHFSNLLPVDTINLAASPTFTLGAAASFDFTGTTTSLTIGGSDIVADSHLYFDISAGQSLTLNSGVSFTGGSFVLQTAGGGTIALNGSISGTSRIWVLGGTTAEIGTTTSAPLIDILGNSTVRFTTSATYTSNIEVQDTATIDTGANNVSISGTVSQGGATNVLAKTGTGTLTLSGTNTASGSMTVSQGTLSVAGDGNLSAGTVTINGGTLAVTG